MRVFYWDQFVSLPLQVPSAEPTVPEKEYDLFSHIPAVYDELVRGKMVAVGTSLKVLRRSGEYSQKLQYDSSR